MVFVFEDLLFFKKYFKTLFKNLKDIKIEALI